MSYLGLAKIHNNKKAKSRGEKVLIMDCLVRPSLRLESRSGEGVSGV